MYFPSLTLAWPFVITVLVSASFRFCLYLWVRICGICSLPELFQLTYCPPVPLHSVTEFDSFCICGSHFIHSSIASIACLCEQCYSKQKDFLVWVPLDMYSGVGALGHCSVQRNLHTVFHVALLIYIFISSVWEFPLLSSLSSHSNFSLVVAVLTGVKWYLIVVLFSWLLMMVCIFSYPWLCVYLLRKLIAHGKMAWGAAL